ncbi:MAG: T9SS type A sorting domain-containing protein [Chitinophagaceae bacterium]|nr:MAG: T9SS type A sorting domain-containing protein [Chitinophagaceae bacterium]
MIRYIVLLVFMVCMNSDLFSQESCLSSQYNLRQQQLNPALLARQQSIAQFLKPSDNEIRLLGTDDNPTEQTVINIPVVIHVLYNGSAQNISDAQILTQLEILNRDFRRKNADSANTPQHFRPFAADCNIIFTLATVNPQGFPTTGIIRKATNVTGFSMDDDIKFSSGGGDEAWDSDKYLNIWVGPMSAGVVGYASAPGSDKNRDGVVIRYNAFGSIGTASAPYNKGRTAVHEIGHWLGLVHIWGDLLCGDDMIDDTPPQQTYTRGCPTGNIIISCNNSPNGNMYMNYMDLTEDACTNMFTRGQKQRMRTLFNDGGPRHALLSSTASAGPGTTPPVNIPVDLADDKKVRVFPNPAKSNVTIDFGGDETLPGQYVSVFNQYGQILVYKVITSNTMTLNTAAFATGVYYIKIGEDKNTIRLLKTAY